MRRRLRSTLSAEDGTVLLPEAGAPAWVTSAVLRCAPRGAGVGAGPGAAAVRNDTDSVRRDRGLTVPADPRALRPGFVARLSLDRDRVRGPVGRWSGVFARGVEADAPVTRRVRTPPVPWLRDAGPVLAPPVSAGDLRLAPRDACCRDACCRAAVPGAARAAACAWLAAASLDRVTRGVGPSLAGERARFRLRRGIVVVLCEACSAPVVTVREHAVTWGEAVHSCCQ